MTETVMLVMEIAQMVVQVLCPLSVNKASNKILITAKIRKQIQLTVKIVFKVNFF